jgi:hypothetical protein
MSIAVRHEPLPPVLTLPEALSPAPAEGAREGEPLAFRAILQSLAAAIHRGESLTRSALDSGAAGQAMSPAALIALQAGIYRYVEAVDLASRLVDRATGAVKSVVQGS